MLVRKEISRWQSKGKTISRSVSHKDMFIIEHENGTWHNVSSSLDIMLRKYPVENGNRK